LKTTLTDLSLSVTPLTPPIQAQKQFIEATSRLTSFSTLSLTPLEIRHTKNKLDLIRRVLSASDEAYKHDGIILDLAEKLGLSSEVEKGEVLGMMADSAVSNGEYDLAFGYSERLVALAIAAEKAEKSNTTSKRGRDERKSDRQREVDGHVINNDLAKTQISDNDRNISRLREVTWKSCLELGRQPEYPSITHRLLLLGRAIEYCPADDSVMAILGEWRKVEDGQLRLSQAAKRRRVRGIKLGDAASLPNSPIAKSKTNRSAAGATGYSLTGTGTGTGEDSDNAMTDDEERVLGSRTAARAAKLAFGFGERFRGNLPMTMPINLASASAAVSAVSPRLPSLSRDRDRSISRDRAGTGKGPAEITSPKSPPRSAILPHAGTGQGGASGTGKEGSSRGSMDSDRISLSGLGFGDVQSDAERVQRQAKRALVKGVGWLLGADEREISQG
jgi:hypothetical protein